MVGASTPTTGANSLVTEDTIPTMSARGPITKVVVLATGTSSLITKYTTSAMLTSSPVAKATFSTIGVGGLVIGPLTIVALVA